MLTPTLLVSATNSFPSCQTLAFLVFWWVYKIYKIAIVLLYQHKTRNHGVKYAWSRGDLPSEIHFGIFPKLTMYLVHYTGLFALGILKGILKRMLWNPFICHSSSRQVTNTSNKSFIFLLNQPRYINRSSKQPPLLIHRFYQTNKDNEHRLRKCINKLRSGRHRTYKHQHIFPKLDSGDEY